MGKHFSGRKKRLSIIKETYRWFDYPKTVCYYCGLPSNGVDHVPPVNAVYALGEDAPNRRLMVPACKECNSLLGDHFLLTLTDRKNYIKEQLRKRYEHALAIPVWHEDELEELGGSLRDFVQNGCGMRDLTLRRIRH